jgi:hypothetical protein
LDLKNKPRETNLVQGALNQNSKSHGHTGRVTHHGAIYTVTVQKRELKVTSPATDMMSVGGGQDEFEVRYMEEKGPKNKAKRLVKEYYGGERDGRTESR